jgi:hypothetical protein
VEQHAIGGAGRGCADDVLGEIGGVGGGREIAESRMGPSLVVIVDPVRDLGPGMIEAEEPCLVYVTQVPRKIAAIRSF